MHKKYSKVIWTDDAGTILGRQTLYHEDKDALQDFFQSLPQPATVAMEATRSWYWLHDLMQGEGLQVKLAHPLKTKLIGEAKIKTDTIDAQVLAQLERTGFLPESYIPPPSVRDHRELLRYRLLLVATRIRLKNRVHDLVDKQGITHPFSDLFGTRGRAFLQSLVLPPLSQKELQRLMELITYLDQQIKSAEKDIKALLKQDPRGELLLTIPGVSHLTTYLLLAEIGDPHRFPSAKKLCSYAGIIPSTHQSGGKTHHGSITKQGNKFIRWAMVEAANIAIRKDPALQAFYEKLKRSKGSGIAKVAVARKLLVAVFHILKKEEAYRFNSLSKIHWGKPVTPV
jgi:transposase